MKLMNVLYIMSDQHQGKASGCYGHDFIQTPNIDKLAASGTRFTRAFTNSAICVPARAALATGKHVHQTAYWDNGHPYEGKVKAWHHMLQENGASATSIGKLHFRNETDDTGFEEQIIPMHVVEGKGDARGCIKRPMTGPMKESGTMTQCGPGDSPYLEYDANIANKACEWLQAKAASPNKDPFCAFVSFVCPHPPYIAPQELYDIYDKMEMPMPKMRDPEVEYHPWIKQSQWMRNYDDFVTEESLPILMKSYYGTTSYLDSNIGKVLATLEQTGLRDSTIVIYTSDHGENLGTRRLWGKSNMYEEASFIPMIISGPDIPSGKVSDTPVTLIDIAPTILDAQDLDEVSVAQKLPGSSLIKLAQHDSDINRVAFTEYHAAAAERSAFMIRKGKYKYIHYVSFEPELFDLDTDPEELTSLHKDAAYTDVLKAMESELREICDPEAVDEAAYQSQCKKVEAAGGRDALMARGKYQGTPAPGHDPVFMT
ncbi:MAG: sulfatase [Rhodospirillaceae bacterium]|nr:sulfatase [Rhodospirillaceae bacterium]|tara:strand:- start:870 stop:2324 length:1455 start_codon:yes stop_codon:yes gene_type:complete